MATYSRTVLSIERVEFHVPAPAPWGAAWVEVQKAIGAAHAELRETGRIGETAEAPDDLITIAPGDDSVIVSYELRMRGGA